MVETLCTAAQALLAIGENATAAQILAGNTTIWINFAESDIGLAQGHPMSRMHKRFCDGYRILDVGDIFILRRLISPHAEVTSCQGTLSIRVLGVAVRERFPDFEGFLVCVASFFRVSNLPRDVPDAGAGP